MHFCYASCHYQSIILNNMASYVMLLSFARLHHVFLISAIVTPMSTHTGTVCTKKVIKVFYDTKQGRITACGQAYSSTSQLVEAQ